MIENNRENYNIVINFRKLKSKYVSKIIIINIILVINSLKEQYRYKYNKFTDLP